MTPTLKVNDAKTPSQAIVEDANRTYTVTDDRGRTIEFRRLGMSGHRRLLKAISNESANKQQLFSMYLMAAAVVSIDGDAISFPANEIQADALIDRLGDDGYAALLAAIPSTLGVQTPEGLREAAGE